MRVARALSLAAWLACLACAPARAPDARPNVLLVVVDTLRADHLGVYGSALGTSPTLDALAADGVVFERAIAAAPSTVPSHAALMTSRHVREIGAGFATGEGRLEAPQTLALAFQRAGYATAAFVGNVVLQRAWGFDRGFDVFDDELELRELNRPGVRERIAEDTTRRAVAWLASERERPVFLWVHYQDPHGPYAAPAPFAGRFRPGAGPVEPALPVLPGNSGRGGIPAYQALEGLLRPSEYHGRYADEIAYADHWLAELLAALDAHPSGREAVVLFTSDHGESLGEANRWFVHDFATTPQLAHVPFVLRAPGIAPGRRDEPVGHVDVLPTLLELAGIERPAGSRGLALGPFLREGRPLPERFVYCDRGAELSAYRGDGFLRATGLRGEAARWDRFVWSADGAWSHADADVEPGPELRDFVGHAAPARPPELDAETREALRALGYLDD